MKAIRCLALAVPLTLVGSAVWPDDAHHPQVAASAAKAPKAAAGKPATMKSIKKMDQQIMAMREMHGKMMNAATPEQRSALMAQHMKSMQGALAMMEGMASVGKDKLQGGTPSDMAARQQMMEKRMEMMESMMQMMMDCWPESTTN